MKYLVIFLSLFAFNLKAQVGQRLKLRQLEQGTPGQTILVDSLGNATYAAAGGADGNGIYGGSGLIPDSTYAEFAGNYYNFAIGYFPDFPNETPAPEGSSNGLLYGLNRTVLTRSSPVDRRAAQLYMSIPSGDTTNAPLVAIEASRFLDSGYKYSRFSVGGSSIYLLREFDGGRTYELYCNNTNDDGWVLAKDYNQFISFKPGVIGFGPIEYHHGSGSPEGVVTAPVGSIYTNTAGGVSTTLYVKTSGAGNTGWTAK